MSSFNKLIGKLIAIKFEQNACTVNPRKCSLLNFSPCWLRYLAWINLSCDAVGTSLRRDGRVLGVFAEYLDGYKISGEVQDDQERVLMTI